jgi:prepilin-type N-terminal cleavage/methylation domain-containing protein
LCRSTNPNAASAGFTLLEVLVALSVVAIGLASIGKLVASSVRGVRSIESHLIRLETARAIMAALPDRDQLTPGALSGEIADHSWRIDVLPFAATDVGLLPSAQWVPKAVVVTVSSPTGAAMKISTISLRGKDQK